MDNVKQLVLKTRRLILREVDNMLGIQFLSVQSSFKESKHALNCHPMCVTQWEAKELCQHVAEHSGDV